MKIKEKYDQSNLENLGHRFTTLYLGNYLVGDMREGVGSHPGVDIYPVEPAQEVVSILDGKVITATQEGSYGKYVIIQHDLVPDPDNLSKKTTLYSCYLHMSDIKVQKGDKIKEGKQIGNTGSTGMTTGEHLHFQIDRADAPYHAYWPYTGQDVKDAGISFMDGVNEGLGIDNAKKYTVNPLVYLDKIKGTNITTNKPDVVISIDKKPDTTIITTHTDDVVVKPDTIISVDTTIKPDEKDKPDIENTSDKDNIKPNKIDVFYDTSDVVVRPDRSDTLIVSTIDNPSYRPDKDKVDEIIDEVIILENKKTFKDLNKNHKYYDYVLKLINKEILKGYDDGTIGLSKPITRAELLKLIFSITNKPLVNDNTNYFIDVPNHMWYKKYINSAVKYDMVSTNNKYFRPSSYISRAEAIKMILRSTVGEIPNEYTKEFLDIKGTEWFTKYVEYSVNKNLIPHGGDKFFPNTDITREDVIGMFYNLGYRD